MEELVSACILLALYIGYKINYKIEVKKLNKKLNEEAERIDALEKRILHK